MAELVSARVVAGILGKSTRWVRDAANRGLFAGTYKIGATWRFDEAKIREWREAQIAEPRPPTRIMFTTGTKYSELGRSHADLLAQLLGIEPVRSKKRVSKGARS